MQLFQKKVPRNDPRNCGESKHFTFFEFLVEFCELFEDLVDRTSSLTIEIDVR